MHFAPHSKEEAKAKLVLGTNASPATYEVELSGSVGPLPQGPAWTAGGWAERRWTARTAPTVRREAQRCCRRKRSAGATGPRGPKGDTGAGLTGATISCKRAKVRRKRVRVRCTLKLAVTSRVRAARITVTRKGRLVARGAGLARHGRVRIPLPEAVRGGSVRVVTIDRSGRLRATRRSVHRFR